MWPFKRKREPVEPVPECDAVLLTHREAAAAIATWLRRTRPGRIPDGPIVAWTTVSRLGVEFRFREDETDD